MTGEVDFLNEKLCQDVDPEADEEWRMISITHICEFGCENGECHENEVPEFGIIAAGVAVIGAVAGFFFLRKR
jgi:hypothetical protein